MTFNPIDVNTLTPFDRNQLLNYLRRKLGEESFEGFLNDNGEEWMIQLAYYMLTEDEKQGNSTPVQLSSTPRYQNGAPAAAVSNLERLRQHMGDSEYRKTLARLGEPAMEEMARKMFGTRPSATRSPRLVRTRESAQKIGQFIFFIALAYGALLGGGYPDWMKFGQVLDSIFYWVIGILFVLGIILVLFFRSSFDFSMIWIYGAMIAIGISAVVGLVINVFSIGIKVLGVGVVAFIGCWLAGALLGVPIFRLVEWVEKTWLKWVIGILAVLLGIGLMILGGYGVWAIFPVN